MTKQHDLKCVPTPFQAKWEDKKSWEYRINDRDYKIGDLLNEKEYDPKNLTYSGREILEEVIWLINGGEFGIPDGYVIMSTKEISRIEPEKLDIHKENFLNKLYDLSSECDYFFDKIKYVFGDWIGDYLAQHDYSLIFKKEVKSNIHTIDVYKHWIVIKIVHNIKENFSDEEFDVWHNFFNQIEGKFEKILDKKKLQLIINGNIEIHHIF